MSRQASFAAALLAEQSACPPGLRAWNDSDPARRFAVYRNNVMVSLGDALADNHPVTQALVGEEFFAAMAHLFVQAHPPRSPVLALYGAELADFIEDFEPVAGLPWLADLARLEMLRVQAFHAVDAVPLGEPQLAGLLAAGDALPQARFSLHPSLGVLRSAHAVVSLWAAHQAADIDAALAQLAIDRPEAALVWRAGLEVEIMRIDAGSAEFLIALKVGATFGAAAQQALAVDSGFDLAAALGLLIRGGAIIGADTSRSGTS
jgi:hypothetical protein